MNWIGALFELNFLEMFFLFFIASMVLFLSCAALFFLIEKMLSPIRTIYAVNLKPNQHRSEFLFSSLFMIIFSLATTTLLKFGVVKFSSFSWKGFFLTFLGMTISFDALYYFAHRLMHTKAFAFMHARHHWSQVVTPLTGFSLGPFESVIWIFSIFSFPVAFASSEVVVFEGMLAYFIFLWVINIWGHCNVETLPRIFNSTFLSTFGHPNTYHAIHHARYVKHHSFILTILDRLFNHVWSDWRTVHSDVLSGKPMTKLTERRVGLERVSTAKGIE